MNERNSGRKPKDGLTNRQREKREIQRKNRRAVQLRNRVIVGGTAVALLLGTAAGIDYAVQSEDLDNRGANSYDISPTPDLSALPLPELKQEDIVSSAVVVASDYARLTGVQIDSQKFVSSVSLAPNISNMTQAEKDKYCGNGLSLKCQEAGAITQITTEIYFYKDAFDVVFSGAQNTEVARKARQERILWVGLHEASHWLGEVNKYEPSDELFSLVQKYYGVKNSFILNENEAGYQVAGAAIRGRNKVTGLFFETFGGLEEAEAENISRYVLMNRGEKTYANFNNPQDTYYIEQRKMLDDLLYKLSPDYSESVRWLSQERVKNGGREEIMKSVGKKFGADDANALEAGFKILFAIDQADFASYRALTQSK